MNEKFEKLTKVVKETKEALYEEWRKKQFFEDCNNFYDAGRGILSDAMGLTAVMLLYVCFAENKGVYGGVDDAETLTIVKSSLEYIYDEVIREGYTAAPLCSVENTQGVIDKEHAYVDTMTWVLSSAVLTVYAVRNKLLTLDTALEEKAIILIADSLARISRSQLDCGAWGFSSDKTSKKSLYSTYAVAASLADFLDYIFGELAYYADDENEKSGKDIQDFYDWKTVDAINTYYHDHPNNIYPKVTVTEMVTNMKGQLQMWLLENCLPVLPKLAECTPLTNDEMERIGMARQTTTDQIEKLGGKDYINLYYAYYIIDILTTSSADKRFERIVSGKDSVQLDDLKAAYKNVMIASDYDYFFEKNGGKIAPTIFKDYINQAIHATRTNFSTARRSGKAFWDSNASELVIPWEHKEISSQKIEEARGDAEITEPALVSMALRANTVYCFYIIERADIAVDQMFDIICDDRSAKTETVKKDTRIKNLWDKTNYSLPITERSIEALVDYSDYLEKTATTTASGEATSFMTVDAAIDSKIAAYLSSNEGVKIIESLGFVHRNDITMPQIDEDAIARIVDKQVAAAVEEKMKVVEGKTQYQGIASTKESAAFDVDAFNRELAQVARWFEIYPEKMPEENENDNLETMARYFMGLHNRLTEKTVQKVFSEQCNGDMMKGKDIAEKFQSQVAEFIEKFKQKYDSDPEFNYGTKLSDIYVKSLMSKNDY